MMLTYLALGDSYTIGELVPKEENFPHQLVQLLHKEKTEVTEPVIIAVTGWTTDELAASIREHALHETFSFVTLLIGVNNQYRGRDLDNYKKEFTELLNQAIVFANGHTQHVFVLSIPDWGVTPFAEGRDRAQIAKEIDAYNAANKNITLAHKCHYLDITDSTRKNGTNPEFLAEDGLHPSGKEYGVWAERLAPMVAKALNP
ncbi:SGNH/GDSL hydrolase family protein [Taibaiella soli]|uniref:SGNH/GDSL hydrolase family protein n=2 Tax=Taibaiella soli TaxID=1649169 RepID=A0A2W2AHB9_9BACT|nr:SGNH/GDSL hydrolase family protein [Taibaiella soli]